MIKIVKGFGRRGRKKGSHETNQPIVIEQGIPIPQNRLKGRGPSALMKAINSMKPQEESFLYTGWPSSIYAAARRAGWRVIIDPTAPGAMISDMKKQEFRIWKLEKYPAIILRAKGRRRLEKQHGPA